MIHVLRTFVVVVVVVVVCKFAIWFSCNRLAFMKKTDQDDDDYNITFARFNYIYLPTELCYNMVHVVIWLSRPVVGRRRLNNNT